MHALLDYTPPFSPPLEEPDLDYDRFIGKAISFYDAGISPTRSPGVHRGVVRCIGNDHGTVTLYVRVAGYERLFSVRIRDIT